jgi:hypothetical protein
MTPSRRASQDTAVLEGEEDKVQMKTSFTTVMADFYDWRSSNETMNFELHSQQSHAEQHTLPHGHAASAMHHQRAVEQMHRALSTWRHHHRKKKQARFAASCAASCADLWKLGNAFDCWLHVQDAPVEVQEAAKVHAAAVNPYSNALRRKRYSTPNRSRRGASPRSAQSAPNHQNFMPSPDAMTPRRSSAAIKDRFEGLLTPAEIFRGAMPVDSSSVPASPLARLTRDAFSDHPATRRWGRERATPPGAKQRTSPPGTRTSFSVSYGFAEKKPTPKSKPANGIGSGRFTRLAASTTPWRGEEETTPWYNSKTASCFRHQAWPEQHAPPEGYARRDVSWQEWQRALHQNAESNAAARARDWRTRGAWLQDRRENTPSKIVPWHVEDGDYSHQNMYEATEKLMHRAFNTDKTVAGDEKLGRTVTGWSSFINRREHALALEGMDLVLNP